jgi:histidinol-phosphate aminotransferase
MSFNESPWGKSPKVVAGIQEAAATIGDYPPMGDELLREALAKRCGRGLTAEHFLTGCSGSETIELVARAYLQAGDEVIISSPTFDVYSKMAALLEAKVVSVPLKQPAFTPDIEPLLI